MEKVAQSFAEIVQRIEIISWELKVTLTSFSYEVKLGQELSAKYKSEVSV